MPTDRRRQRLSEIVYYAVLVDEYTGGHSYEIFRTSTKTILAVERCLQCITEAAVKLGSEDVYDIVGLDMQDLKDFGNVLRHDYDQVAPDEIWNLIQNRLPALRRAAKDKLDMLDLSGSGEDD